MEDSDTFKDIYAVERLTKIFKGQITNVKMNLSLEIHLFLLLHVFNMHFLSQKQKNFCFRLWIVFIERNILQIKIDIRLQNRK